MGQKTRNPQDTTLRNLRAEKRRIALLEQRLAAVEDQVHTAWSIKVQVQNIDARLTELETKLKASA